MYNIIRTYVCLYSCSLTFSYTYNIQLDDSAESEDERKMATPKSPIFVDDEPTCSKYVPGTSRYEPTLNNVQGTSHYT